MAWRTYDSFLSASEYRTITRRRPEDVRGAECVLCERGKSSKTRLAVADREISSALLRLRVESVI